MSNDDHSADRDGTFDFHSKSEEQEQAHATELSHGGNSGTFDSPPSDSDSDSAFFLDSDDERNGKEEVVDMLDEKARAYGMIVAASVATVAVSTRFIMSSDDPDIPDDPTAVFRGDEVGINCDGGTGATKGSEAVAGGDYGGGGAAVSHPTGQEAAACVAPSPPPPPLDMAVTTAVAPPPLPIGPKVTQIMALQAAKNAADSVASSCHIVVAGGSTSAGAAVSPMISLMPLTTTGVSVVAATVAVVAGFWSRKEVMPHIFPQISPQISSASFCGREGTLRNGQVTILLDGFSRLFNETEEFYLREGFLDAYNEAAGGCRDIFDRHLVNASITSAHTFNMDDDIGKVCSSWNATVRCHGCPAFEPLFSSAANSTKNSTGESDYNEPTVNFLGCAQIAKLAEVTYSNNTSLDTNATSRNETSVSFDNFLIEFQLAIESSVASGFLDPSFSSVLGGTVLTTDLEERFAPSDVSSMSLSISLPQVPSTAPSTLPIGTISQTPTTAPPSRLPTGAPFQTPSSVPSPAPSGVPPYGKGKGRNKGKSGHGKKNHSMATASSASNKGGKKSSSSKGNKESDKLVKVGGKKTSSKRSKSDSSDSNQRDTVASTMGRNAAVAQSNNIHLEYDAASRRQYGSRRHGRTSPLRGMVMN